MPIASPPVEIVEVATVEVALKFPNVGVEVAVMTPEELCAELSRDSEDECESEVGHCVGHQQ